MGAINRAPTVAGQDFCKRLISIAGAICGPLTIFFSILTHGAQAPLDKIIGSILGGVALLSAPISIILGTISIIMIRKKPMGGRKYALAGIIIGLVTLLLILMLIILTESSQQIPLWAM